MTGSPAPGSGQPPGHQLAVTSAAIGGHAMIVAVPATDFADLFLARHPRFAGFVDSDEANAQAALLRANGLDAVNAKVLQSPPAEILDVIAEHNVGAMLVRRGFTNLRHDP